MEKKYYLHKRDGIYYAEIVNKIDGKKMTAKSTRMRDVESAEKVVAKWLSGEESDTIKKGFDILSAVRNSEISIEESRKIIEILKSKNLINQSKDYEDYTKYEEYIEYSKILKRINHRKRIKSKNNKINILQYNATIEDINILESVCKKAFLLIKRLSPKAAYYDEVFNDIFK